MAKKQTPKTTKKAQIQKAQKTEPKAAKAKAEAPTVEKKVTPQAPTPEPKAAAPSLPPDSRLPAVGTVIQKRDRHGEVRCECTVEKEGIRYVGTLYRSISSAALAAAGDLGLKNKTQNGFVFWGLKCVTKKDGDPLAALERTWGRYWNRCSAVASSRLGDEMRTSAANLLASHAEAIGKLADSLRGSNG
jgi:hypothetical protein